MKLQCPCGAKYSFDITPEMAREPVQFVCPTCGFDASDFVNEMIRKELAEQAAAGAGGATLDEPVSIPAAAPRLRVSHHAPPPASPSPEAPSPAPPAKPKVCAKHPGQLATEHCVVCSKPICPQCMEVFGYVCSALCKARAASHGIAIPFYEGQKSVIEAKKWRKAGLISSVVGGVVAVLLGAWIWYAWFGSMPRPVFAVRFEDRVYSGMSKLAGKDQLVFLRGGTLARYDLKSQKQIWSRDLVDKVKIERLADAELKAMAAAVHRAQDTNPDYTPKMPSREKMIAQMIRDAEAALQLRVGGQNVWVVSPEALTHFEWDTGKTLQAVPRASGFGRVAVRGDELTFTGANEVGQPVLTHVNLASGELTKEDLGGPVRPDAGVASVGDPGPAPTAGLPLGRGAGGDAGKALDPEKVAQQAQSLSLPGKIALPATLANAAHNEAIASAMNGSPNSRSTTAPKRRSVDERFQLIPSPHGNVEFSTRLLEEKLVERTAMKAPPRKSALNGDLTATKTADVANEILNEMQRSRGGDKVTEDASRYQVTIHLPDNKDAQDWTGEVTGTASVFALKTVNVITAGKSVIVLDKTNKQLWQAALTFEVAGRSGDAEEEASPYGQGPCVEHGDTLYVFDQAVLTAFDLPTGNARWRLPSVGVVGLFFDDQGMVYVNTTTASPDKIRYSRQIDINDRTSSVIFKLDPKSGKTLWSSDQHGFITSVSGKFIYSLQSYCPDEDEDANDNDMTAILKKQAYVRIHRINPANGRLMWEIFQPRGPLDVRIDGNSIEIVFKKEVQVLRFLSL